MRTVFDVAEWFLSKASMTNKKLQKLCYYAQAWYCALYDGTPLFDSQVQAWVHGPVIPELYYHYSRYKWNEIPKVKKVVPFDRKEESVLCAVYDAYGKFDGDQLECLTHEEKPWQDMRIGYEPFQSCNKEITTAAMRKYYGERYSAIGMNTSGNSFQNACPRS